MGTVNVFLGPSATSQNSADYTLSGWDSDGGALTLTSWSWTETANGGYVVSHANLVPGCSYWLRKTSGGTPWAQGEIPPKVILADAAHGGASATITTSSGEIGALAAGASKFDAGLDGVFLADAVDHGGTTATLTLGSIGRSPLSITGTDYPAIAIETTGGGGGTESNAINIVSELGNAMRLYASESGKSGFEATGGSYGIEGRSLLADGAGIYGRGVQGYGIRAEGQLGGADFSGDDIGVGMSIRGGGTSGEGLEITTTDGDGVLVSASGTGKKDINAPNSDLGTAATAIALPSGQFFTE